MRPEKERELEKHIQAIAKILYEDSEAEEIKDLRGIEETVREKTLKHIAPKIGFFLSKKRREQKQEEKEK